MNKELTVRLYQEINAADKPRAVDHWHASSIAKCPRALFFERKGVPAINEPGGGKKLRWRSGHAIEDTIRPELQKIYPQLLTNVRFTNTDLDLTGEFDAYDPETHTLISVKSVHDFAMVTRDNVTGLKDRIGTNAKGNAVWGLKDGPYLHHEWQEHGYVVLMQDTSMVPEAITYVYVTLGGLIACYSTEINSDILQGVRDKVGYLSKCWSNSELPVCVCQPDQAMYNETNQYCDYKSEKGCCEEELYER